MGENLIEDTVKYLHSHNYHENHPWLVKFGSENLITAAQRLADQGHHEQSLEMYEKLLNDKQISPIKYSSPLTSSITAVALVRSSDNQVPQELQLIGKGKFTSMLGKIKSLINKGKFIESKEILKECSEFLYQYLFRIFFGTPTRYSILCRDKHIKTRKPDKKLQKHKF